MITRGKILIIDDDESMGDACFHALTRQGYEVAVAPNGKSGLKAFEESTFDVVLVDMRLPDMDGMEILNQIRDQDPQGVVIIISGFGTIPLAVEAIKAGAYDFFPKPFEPDELRMLVKRALDARRLSIENIYLKQELKKKEGTTRIVFQSQIMAKIFHMIDLIAPTDSTVLITGESGTGKGLIARQIHEMSSRSKNPFVAIDSGALVETLFESELFGHVKGSFTGAESTKIGKFELAQGGSIFFDEVANIGLDVQAKLLRVVEEKRISKVGSNRSTKVDVRIIAATNKNLEEAIKRESFREDLFFRLNVMRLHLPPLRERKEDLPLLVSYFLERLASKYKRERLMVSKEAMKLLTSYRWPGNVRELENTLERVVILTAGSLFDARDFVFAGLMPRDQSVSEGSSLADAERNHISLVLHRARGNKSEAAKVLGIDRKTLREKIRRYRIPE
ncbi:MAG: sigma-54 dependent transcriptional regulator [Pseudomonadota bacterium]